MKLLCASDTNQVSSSTRFGAASNAATRRSIMHKVWLALTLAAAFGCSDRNIEIAQQLMQEDPAGGPPTVLTVVSCQSYGFLEMDRACVVDSDGKSYGFADSAGSGKMIVTSGAPPYGVYFLFTHDTKPLAADVSTEGAEASVRVSAAAACNVLGGCIPESDEANRVAARASLTAEGGLLVSVHEALPPGTQVAVNLAYSALYRGRVAPADGSACSLPFELCSDAIRRGWAARFYVGAIPALANKDGAVAKGAGQ
jgi:hypothetical protein